MIVVNERPKIESNMSYAPPRRIYIEFDRTAVNRCYNALNTMYINNWNKDSCALRVGIAVYYSLQAVALAIYRPEDVTFELRSNRFEFDGVPVYIGGSMYNVELLTGPDGVL